jgi:hypothetical protein
MRMPLLSYFFVVGSALLGLLLLLDNGTQPSAPPVRTSQVVGVPEPFKAAPEPPLDLRNANFAAEYHRPAKAAAAPEPPKKRKSAGAPAAEPRATRKSFAEYAHDNIGIH